MKKPVTILFFLSMVFPAALFAQIGDNCSNPKPVNIACPSIMTFVSEFTSGFTNDVNTWSSTMSGKDIVYEVTIPDGSPNILVSITSSSAPLTIYSTNNNCNGSHTFARTVAGGFSANNISIPVSGIGPYYIWIDHNNPADITYSIAFGAFTDVLPNTKGFWRLDEYCIFPITKPYLEVTYNGVHKDIPIEYSPLGVSGTVCASVFFENQSGNEGVKSVRFVADTDLSGFAPVTSSLPGFYNTGTWTATTGANSVEWTFSDAANFGRGDYTGSPTSCLQYTFCFTMTPLSNDPTRTKIVATFNPDGYGAGGNVGCCASAFNCSAGTSSGASGPIAIAFDDPALPVLLSEFEVIKGNGYNHLQWTTGYEENFEKFEVERSEDGLSFTYIGTVQGSTTTKGSTYRYNDSESAKMVYYRLKMIDKDRNYSYSPIRSVTGIGTDKVKVHPIPAGTSIFITSTEPVQHVELYDLYLKQVKNLELKAGQQNEYDIASISSGIYIIRIHLEDRVITSRIIKE